jgi:DNA-binding protein H-NS
MEMILPMIETQTQTPTPGQMPVVTDEVAAEKLAADFFEAEMEMITTDEVAAATLAADNSPAALAERRAALQAQLAAVEAQLQAQATAERAELIRGINETMHAHGITLADLGARDKPVTRLAKGEPKPSALAGKKVAPKYRDQETGETWSGRGLQPKWLKARIAGGAELESFRVA